MNLFFIADPQKDLNLKTDTTYALASEGLIQGHQSYWVHSSNVISLDGKPFFHDCQSLSDQRTVSLTPTPKDLIFIRKNPPFDQSYLDLCWLLNQNHLKTLNSAETLTWAHEKILHFKAYHEDIIQKSHMIPTAILKTLDQAKSYLNHHKCEFGYVVKPWLGFGGKGVCFYPDQDSLLQNWTSDHEYQIIQPYLPEIQTHGDRRVIIVNGKILGHFTRFPQGNIISNLAQGGIPRLTPWTPEEKNLAERLGLFLLKNKIYFAGIDMIGSKIGEINVTSPTGLITLQDLTGENVISQALGLLVSSLFEV
jgi:glutathione synthase